MSQTTDWDIERLDQLTEELARLVGQIRSAKAAPASSPRLPAIPMNQLSPLLPRYASMAKAEYAARRRRKTFIDEALLGEAVWDMLLDLYVSRVEGRQISVSSACIASSVPPTTALRYVAILERRGLIVRHDDQFDQRRSYLQMSDKCFVDMTRYFAERDSVVPSTDGEQIESGLIQYDLSRQDKVD